MSTELGVSGNRAGSPFQQVFHMFCSLHLQGTGSYQCQEKYPGIECDIGQQGVVTSGNESPQSKQLQTALSQPVAWHLCDLRQAEAKFLHLENRFEHLWV